MSISKVELKKYLSKMGIEVKGNYIRKKDVKKIKRKVKAGSLVEYSGWMKENKEMGDLINKNFDLRDGIYTNARELQKNAKKLLEMAKNMEDGDFPDDPRSSEGKLGFISLQEKVIKNTDKIIEDSNLGIG